MPSSPCADVVGRWFFSKLCLPIFMCLPFGSCVNWVPHSYLHLPSDAVGRGSSADRRCFANIVSSNSFIFLSHI